MPTGTPMAMPSSTEAMPTCRETRAPQMTRDKVSRPKRSVPSRYDSVPGGFRRLTALWRTGSWGAIHGAAMATKSSNKMRMAPATAARLRRNTCRRRRARDGPRAASAAPGAAGASWLACTRGSLITNPRIHQSVQQIGNQVDDDDQKGEHHQEGLQRGIVAPGHGAHDQAAQTRPVEHDLGHDRAAQEHPRVQADQGDDGNERVLEGMFDHHAGLGH